MLTIQVELSPIFPTNRQLFFIRYYAACSLVKTSQATDILQDNWVRVRLSNKRTVTIR